jgi:putative transposase
MKYRFLRDHAGIHRVEKMCRMLEVSRSGYYVWRKRPMGRRRGENLRLVTEIRAVHRISKETYGSPRIHAQLRDQGISCGKHRVARLMRIHGIKPRYRRKFRPTTTDSAHSLPVAPNLLDRHFEAVAPNRVWVADITYIPTREGWMYLAVLLDLFSRAVVGWAMSSRITRELALDALRMALTRRRPPRGLLHHSDRGSQYASGDYRTLLEEHGLVCSMSRKGDCYDNAVAESFFSSLKKDRVHHRNYTTRAEARRDLFDYIEVFYNRLRRHSYLGYCTPAEFEVMRLVA